jgi:thymidine phosphorylase
MVKLGNSCGVNTRAVITNMDAPLGRAAGNWLEVKEAVACLTPRPGSTDAAEDLREVVLLCAAHLLVQTGKAGSLASAQTMADECLNSGQPRKKWDEMIAAQGADVAAFQRKLGQDSVGTSVKEIQSRRTGCISGCNARVIGEVVRDLGGGRRNKESTINHEVGIDRLAKIGETVESGATLARVHAASAADAELACQRVLAAFEISDTVTQPSPVLIETIMPP